MRLVLQRVSFARVQVNQTIVGSCGKGLLLLTGIAQGDDEKTIQAMAKKVAELRIFSDDQGKMNRSLLDIQGECLVVSQFTLFADCTQGRRPFFGGAEVPDKASAMCDAFVAALKAQGITKVEAGIFGADMQVELCNDGPVTILLDSLRF